VIAAGGESALPVRRQELHLSLPSPTMGLFNRKKASESDSGDSENKKEKGGWKRPASMHS